jgi:hypothetical protein
MVFYQNKRSIYRKDDSLRVETSQSRFIAQDPILVDRLITEPNHRKGQLMITESINCSVNAPIHRRIQLITDIFITESIHCLMIDRKVRYITSSFTVESVHRRVDSS